MKDKTATATGDDLPVVRALLSPTENLAVGAFGGALETCLQMPILTYKFCLQEGRALPPNIASWYRGVGVQAGTVAPITAIQFMVNGSLERLTLRGETRELTDIEKVGTAAGAGAISAFVYSPVDLITIQQQKLCKNPLQTAQHIMHEHGVAGMFRGFASCAVREAVYTAGYLGFAPVLTLHMSHNVDFLKDKPLSAGIGGACMSGIIASFLTHPVDTAKTNVQSDMVATTFPTARQTFGILVNEGGMQSLFKGFIPRSIRICGAFFVCMSLREVAINYKTEH